MEEWHRVGRSLRISQSAHDQIRKECRNEEEIKKAMLTHYATVYPLASWDDVVKKLRHFSYLNAAEVVKGKYITT